jgi:hypothetical protein
MQRSRQAAAILILAAVMLAAWSAARPWLPRAAFAETPVPANRIRLQAWLMDPPHPVVLAGTSLSARLLPGYFEGSPAGPVSVLALEGLSPDTSLALVLRRDPPPKLVLLEAHRLEKPLDDRDAEILEAPSDPGMTLARLAPGLRADVRPSSMLYAWLKTKRPTQGAVARPVAADALAQAPAPGWEERLGARIKALRARGCRVALVRLPAGRENPEPADVPTIADRMAAEWGVPVLDVHREAVRRNLPMTYTDGLHLDAPTAKAAAALLSEMAAPLARTP